MAMAMLNSCIPIFIVHVAVDRFSGFWALALLPALLTASACVDTRDGSPGGDGGPPDRCGLLLVSQNTPEIQKLVQFNSICSQNTPKLGQFNLVVPKSVCEPN